MTNLRDEFSGVRVRLQRTKDYRFFHGWATDVCRNWIVVKMSEHRVLSPGDEFLAEIHGRTRRGKCRVKFQDVDGADYYKMGGKHRMTAQSKALIDSFAQDYEFVVDGPIDFDEPVEAFRVAVHNVAGMLHLGRENVECMLVDVAENGMAIDVDRVLKVGTNVEVTVMAMIGPIRMCGCVSACGSSPLGSNLFRVGLAVATPSRIDVARWRSFIGQGDVK